MLYHLNNVSCNGSESILTECANDGAVINCYGRKSAGALCTGS